MAIVNDASRKIYRQLGAFQGAVTRCPGEVAGRVDLSNASRSLEDA